MITAPASGLVERSPLSFPLMFLGFGFALGEGGLGVIEMGRQVLKIEAGMNNIVVLPVILVLIAVALGEVADASGWALLFVRLLLLGPAIGFAIGGLGSWAMAKIDARTPRSAASTKRSTTSGWSSRRTRRPPPPGATAFWARSRPGSRSSC